MVSGSSMEIKTNQECKHQENCILSVTSKVPPARLHTTQHNPALRRSPALYQEQAEVLRLVETELHECQSNSGHNKGEAIVTRNQAR